MNRLLVLAGGTGGHVYPALAVAEKLRRSGVEVVWVGTQSGLEARAVPDAGFEIEWVDVKGLRGKGLGRWLMLPFVLGNAMRQTWSVISRRQPDALLGMGGFVAGPGGLVGWLRRRPLIIHEQNAVCGLTNWFLSLLGKRVLTGFPKSGLPVRDALWVGNPVREAIAAIGQDVGDSAFDPITSVDTINVLIVGGSQGARALNRHLAPSLATIGKELGSTEHSSSTSSPRLSIWHQSGRNNAESVKSDYANVSLTARVTEFIDDMAQAYRWADLIVCRAGAMTVAEVASSGVAAVFVPYPHAVGDHQAVNASMLVEAKAALMVREGDGFEQRLTTDLRSLITDPARLRDMARRARSLAKPDACDTVAEVCLEVMNA